MSFVEEARKTAEYDLGKQECLHRVKTIIGELEYYPFLDIFGLSSNKTNKKYEQSAYLQALNHLKERLGLGEQE
jgi:hypothetical protein